MIEMVADGGSATSIRDFSPTPGANVTWGKMTLRVKDDRRIIIDWLES